MRLYTYDIPRYGPGCRVTLLTPPDRLVNRGLVLVGERDETPAEIQDREQFAKERWNHDPIRNEPDQRGT